LRLHRPASAALIALVLITSACSGGRSAERADSSDAGPSQPTSAGASEAASEGAAAAFPVTIEHKFGETVITEAPERIVTVGLVEQDALLALGIVPVATTEWFGEYPGSIWPWAEEALGGAAPPASVGTSAEVNVEAVLAQDPDLVLALYSGLTEEQYDALSARVPTIAQPADYVDYGIGWDQLTLTVGRAVGQAEEAEALVADVEAQFEQVRADHPEFAGASAVVATPYEGVYVYGPEDVRGRFLTALGFELPPDLVEITGEEYGGNLSEERADLLDLDLVIWLDAEGVEDYGGPLYESFAVHTQAREVFLDSFEDPLGGATSFVTVLSLPYLLDGIVPKLAAAVDGDPATEVP
jgi:iron complex transport system substrate-binding protein